VRALDRSRDEVYNIVTLYGSSVNQWMLQEKGTLCDSPDCQCKQHATSVGECYGTYKNIFTLEKRCDRCFCGYTSARAPTFAELLQQEPAWVVAVDDLRMFDLRKLGPYVNGVTCSVTDCKEPAAHQYRGTRLVICEKHFKEWYSKK
jgi:hypothetical protein